MIQLSIITDEVSQSLETAIAFAKRHSLEGVELRSVWDVSIFDATRESIEKMDALLKEAGLRACSLSLPFYKCALNDLETRAIHLEKLKIALEHARLLGASCVRGFTFWDEGGDLPLEAIVEAYAPVIPLLEAAGIPMALEPDPSLYGGTATRLAQILTAINSPWVKAVWDGGNLLFHPQGEEPTLGYALLKPWICHAHWKDAKKIGEEVKSVRIGTGASNIPGQLRLFAEDGYSAWMSLETHYRLTTEINEELMRLPGGSDFSRDGLAASEESMISLIECLKEAGLR